MPIRMDPRTIFLNGGRVTSRDKSLIRENGLTVAEGIEYLANNPAPRTILGRTRFNAAAEVVPYGLRWLQFDSGVDMLILAVGGAYKRAAAALSGTLTDLVTGLSGGTALDSVFLGGSHILMNGSDRNRVVASDGTVQFQGMLDNTSAPTVTYDAGGFSLDTGFTVDYWIEERVKDAAGTILKRNGGAKFVRIVGDGTTKKPVVARPAIRNTEATHWALYGTATNVEWPVGAEIAEVAIATASISDTRTGANPQLPTGATYELISVNAAGVLTAVPKWGEPPISSTGDVFEESVVQNDVNNPTFLVFTDYRNIHSVPAVNVFRPGNTKYHDEVRLVRAVNNTFVVCLADSVKRINILPRQRHATFEPERAVQGVQAKHGCVGPQAGDVFDLAGEGEFLAYVSPYGVHITNGGPEGEPVSGDMDWENEVDVDSLADAVLVNDPARYQLRFYHRTPAGQRVETRLHYHSSHLIRDEGGLKFKIAGPYPISTVAATVAHVSGKRRLFTANEDGFMYVENNGTRDQARTDGKIASALESAEIYTGGVLFEGRQHRVALHHSAAPGQEVHVTIISRNEGKDDNPIFRSGIALTRRELTKLFKSALGESIIIRVEKNDALGPVQVDFLVAGSEQKGSAD